MKSDLEAQARMLAAKIDPCMIGGPDARLLIALADALKAKDAEIAILKEGLRTALNLADMYVNERDTGSIYRNGMARARQALQDTDNASHD